MPAPGEQKEQIIKENYPVLGDSGRALCEVETKSTRPEEQYHSLVESDDFSEWNPDQKRLFGTFGWKSCWQFNHEPELSWIENDAEKGCLRMSCKKAVQKCHAGSKYDHPEDEVSDVHNRSNR